MKRNFINRKSPPNANKNKKGSRRRSAADTVRAIRDDINSGGRRHSPRPARMARTGAPKLSIHPIAARYFNALTQPFHPAITQPYIPDSTCKSSLKYTARFRNTIQVNAQIPVYIFFAPSAANDRNAIFIVNSSTVDTTYQIPANGAGAGINMNAYPFATLPYGQSTLQTSDVEFRCVSAGIKITFMNGPSNRGGTITHYFTHDIQGLSGTPATDTIQAYMDNSTGPHTRMYAISEGAPFEATFGPYTPNAVGWFSCPDNTTVATSVNPYAVQSQLQTPWSAGSAPVPNFRDMIRINSTITGEAIIDVVGHYEFTGGQLAGFQTPSVPHPDVTHVTSAVAHARTRHALTSHSHFSEVATSALKELMGHVKAAGTAEAGKLLPIIKSRGLEVASAALAALI